MTQTTTNSNIKIILIGDSTVGKTTLRKRYMGEGFRRSYTATIGADYSVKKIHDRKITIVDLAGDKRSKLIRQQHYHNVGGFLVVFDITNRSSFENLSRWFEEIGSAIRPNLKVFVLGNKDDLREVADDPVPEDEAYSYVRGLELKLEASISYLSTSALTGYNVEVAFNKLVTEIIFN